MPSKNTTTVVLTEKAQVIKEDLAPVFGLKNILSAGLLLLGKLTATEQKSAIAEANSSLEEGPLQNPDEEFRRRVLEVCQEAQIVGVQKKPARKARKPKSA